MIDEGNEGISPLGIIVVVIMCTIKTDGWESRRAEGEIEVLLSHDFQLELL